MSHLAFAILYFHFLPFGNKLSGPEIKRGFWYTDHRHVYSDRHLEIKDLMTNDGILFIEF
jgi:hypothetical protein